MCDKLKDPLPPPQPANAASGQTNTLSPPYGPRAPQLAVAVNTCTPPEKEQKSLAADAATTITEILKQICSRLKGGLDPVWKGSDGHDPEWEPQTSKTKDENALIEAEEKWARLCSELLVGVTYGSINNYGAQAPGVASYDDTECFRLFWTSDPVIPIYLACQQLCTYALMMRGFSTYDLSGHAKAGSGKDDQKPDEKKAEEKPKEKKKGEKGAEKKAGGSIGVSAGNNGTLDHMFQGGWDPKPAFANIEEALKRKQGSLTPGSLFGFLPPGGGQPQGSHVVFVLRSAPSVRKVQFIDTGAVRDGSGLPGRSLPGIVPASMSHLPAGYGNYDDRLFGGTISVTASNVPVPFVGFGALKPANPADLERGIAQGRLVRPLGFARLALFKRSAKPSDKDILYVSPLVTMYEPGPNANYAPSRYLWSIRQNPAYDVIQALWILRIPQNALAVEMIRGGRNKSPAELMKAANNKALKTAIWYTDESDGCVYMYRRHKTESYIDKDEKDTAKKTKVRDAYEGPRQGNPLAEITKKLESLDPFVDYVSPSIQGKIDIPDYLKPR